MSDQIEQTQKRRGRPRKTAEDAMDPPARQPAISMTSRTNAALARRLAGQNVFGGGTKKIPLKEEARWNTRIANGDLHEQRLYEMRHDLGWEPLLPEDLSCTPEEAGFRVNESGYLVRGQRGQEMAFKMAKEDFAVLTQRKTERNSAEIGRPNKVKENVANAVANEHGSEAGDFVHSHFVGTVTDTKGPLGVA